MLDFNWTVSISLSLPSYWFNCLSEVMAQRQTPSGLQVWFVSFRRQYRPLCSEDTTDFCCASEVETFLLSWSAVRMASTPKLGVTALLFLCYKAGGCCLFVYRLTISVKFLEFKESGHSFSKIILENSGRSLLPSIHQKKWVLRKTTPCRGNYWPASTRSLPAELQTLSIQSSYFLWVINIDLDLIVSGAAERRTQFAVLTMWTSIFRRPSASRNTYRLSLNNHHTVFHSISTSISIWSLILLTASPTVLFCQVYVPSAVPHLSCTKLVCFLPPPLPPWNHSFPLFSLSHIYRPVSHVSRSQNSIYGSAGEAVCYSAVMKPSSLDNCLLVGCTAFAHVKYSFLHKNIWSCCCFFVCIQTL